MPKRMSKIEVGISADKKAEALMVNVGVGNAKRIALAMYHWLKREEQRQKAKG